MPVHAKAYIKYRQVIPNGFYNTPMPAYTHAHIDDYEIYLPVCEMHVCINTERRKRIHTQKNGYEKSITNKIKLIGKPETNDNPYKKMAVEIRMTK